MREGSSSQYTGSVGGGRAYYAMPLRGRKKIPGRLSVCRVLRFLFSGVLILLNDALCKPRVNYGKILRV